MKISFRKRKCFHVSILETIWKSGVGTYWEILGTYRQSEFPDTRRQSMTSRLSIRIRQYVKHHGMAMMNVSKTRNGKQVTYRWLGVFLAQLQVGEVSCCKCPNNGTHPYHYTTYSHVAEALIVMGNEFYCRGTLGQTSEHMDFQFTRLKYTEFCLSMSATWPWVAINTRQQMAVILLRQLTLRL